MKYNKEDIINGYIKLKERIIESKVMLLPNAIIKDEETLNVFLNHAVSMIGKDLKDYDKKDKIVTNVLGKIAFQSLNILMEKDPDMVNNYYNKIMEADPEEYKGTNIIEIFSNHLKQNLIVHEEYEKVMDIDKKLKENQ